MLTGAEEFFYFDYEGTDVFGPLPLCEICELWRSGRLSQNTVLTKGGEPADWKNLFFYYHELIPQESSNAQNKRLLQTPLYVNPFRLFASLGLQAHNLEEIDLAVIRKYRKRALAEFELHEGHIVLENRYDIGKSQGIRALEDLDSDEKREFHFSIFKDRLLDEFLESGDLAFFEHSHCESLYKYEPFLEFITPYFAEQFDRCLASLTKAQNASAISRMAAIEPVVTPVAKERCYTRTYSYLKEQVREIGDLVRRIEQSNNDEDKLARFQEVVSDVKRRIHVATFNALPAYFQAVRSESARSIRAIVLALENKHGDTQDALDLATLALELETDELTRSKLEEDKGELSQRARRKEIQRCYGPIRALCEEAAKDVERDPTSADKVAERIFSAAPHMLFEFSNRAVPDDALNQAKDEIALVLMHCAVVFGNKTEKWKSCIAILEQSLGLAVSADVKARVIKNRDIVHKNHELYGNLSTISSAPSLSTINGIGLTLYGQTDLEPTSGSYLTTYYFVFLGIPIFPICRYRVTRNGNSYRFLGKAPLRTFDRWHLTISIGLIVLLIIILSAAGNTPTPTSSYSAPSVSYPSSYTAPLSTSKAPPSSYSASPTSTHTAPSSYTAPSPYISSNTYSVPSYITSELDRDKQAIENEKAKATALESRLEEFAQRVESEKAKVEQWQSQLNSLNADVERARIYLDQTSQADVDDFNRKVNRYNSALRSVRAENESANQMVDSHNVLLDQARAQNRLVNRMVDDYNAKLKHHGR